MFGLSPDVIRNIKKEFSKFPQIEKVILYGSRAKGNYKDGSDIDVTLIGKNLNLKTVYALEEFLEALYLPYSFDISIFTQIDNDDLIEHILNVGKDFYIKGVDKKLHETGALSLPEGWSVKKLENIESIDFLRGNGLSKSVLNPKGKNKCIHYGELYTVYKHPIIDKIKSKTDVEGRRLSVLGDVLVPGTTTADAMGIAIARALNKNDVIIGGDINIVRTRNLEIFSSFLSYYLNGPAKKELASYANGTNILHLSNKKIKKIQVPFPSLFEQKRIVSILDRAFKVIDQAKTNAEQNLINAKELFESYLQNIFENKGNDWEEKTLEEVSEVFGRGKSKHRPRNDKKLYGGDYPFIQTGNIRNCEHYITEYSQTYNDVGLAQSKLWQKGTICITIAANIAETGILSFDACFPDSVIGVVVNKKIADLDFVEYLLQSFKVNLQTLGKGSAQDNINIGTFKGKLFPFPVIKEQKKIVKKLDSLQTQTKKLETIYQQKIADLEELKKSILQKAFNGELSK
uniref:restriction endonuclease subunit S n=1 Tax=Candidatus Thiodubiliella endoseptemdiera TaxID=2738886 RepID=UPI0034DEB305